jgi:MFS family permease
MLLVYIFLIIFAFNLAPAFTPPTWMLLSYIQVTYHPHVLMLALVGALAATAGRLLLAKLADVIVRDRFLSPRTRANLDVVKNELQKRKELTFSIFLFYAFSPLPSNQLFLAYGLTDLSLSLIALPFFIGRFVSYLFWIVTASTVANTLASTTLLSGGFLKSYFFIVQALTLVLVYVFTRIDWRTFFEKRKITWLK